MLERLVLLLSTCSVAGCGLLGVNLEPVAVSVQKPSNVAVYVSVADGDQPVSGLSEQNFSVFENEQALPPADSKLVLLERDVAAVHHALVLVDVSGSASDTERRALARGVAGFVARARAGQGITVYAFDGSAELQLIGDWEKNPAPGAGPEALDALQNLTAKDNSRNLYGAMMSGMKELDARLMRFKKPVRVGTLVVYSRGPDLAGRATEDQVWQELDRSHYAAFAIGVGEPEGYWLQNIGRSGVVKAQSLDSVGIAFEDMATKVDARLDAFYLVSYCSPARAGVRRLRLEVSYPNKEGEVRKGSLSHEFDATGFEAGCDPRATPHFVVGTSKIE
jgi:hypothetical protein